MTLLAPAQTDLLDLTPEELTDALAALGHKPYRARQILAAVWRRLAGSFDEMTDMPQSLREELGRRYVIGAARVEEVARSEDVRTAKYLFALGDGAHIEAVAMREEGRLTACLSSQVGCAMGCAFCATATLGFTRNLTCGEMLAQALLISRLEARITNIVFMGMGEPLLNVPSLLKAVAALADPSRFGLGTRKITISTCGIIPGIEALAESAAPVRLALSLNSPFDDQRRELMPVSARYPLAEVLAACDAYTGRTGKPVLLEYVLLRGINTSPASARELVRIARRLDGKVNLIEYNPTQGLPFRAPETPETLRFRDLLMKEGVTVTIRFRRGRDIAAGCGQLAARRIGAARPPGGRP